MKYVISNSKGKVWVSIGIDIHFEISNVSDLEQLKNVVDQKVALKILKEIHNLRKDKRQLAIDIPKSILAFAMLVAFFWLGTSHLYLLQSHFNPPSKDAVSTSATPTGSFCPGSTGSTQITSPLDKTRGLGFDTTRMDQAIAQLEEMKTKSQAHVAPANSQVDSQDIITDDDMDNAKYTFGYNN